MSNLISGAYSTNHCSKKGRSKKGVWRKIAAKRSYVDPTIHSFSKAEIDALNKSRGI